MRRVLGCAQLSALAAVGLAAVGLGCGSNRPERLPESGATLEGTITYGGEPIRFANVMVTDGSTSAYGTVDEDGRYKVENVPVGPVKVGVNTDEAKGEHTSLMMSGGGAYQGPDKAAGGRSKGKGGAPKFIAIPEKYFFPESSGLTTTTTAGSTTYDIAIPKGK